MSHEVLKFAFIAFVFCCGAWVLRPLVAAVAQRVAGGAKPASSPDELVALRAELLDEVHQMRSEVGELAERVDFTERLLARHREPDSLAPPGSR